MTVSALVTSAPISIALLVLGHTGDDAAAHGLRLALTVGLTLLLAGAAVGLALVPLCARAWRGRYWSPARRVYFTVLAAGPLLALPLLWRYHLLGYWLG